MRKHSLAAALCAASALLASAADNRPTDSIERPFPAGGRIRFELSAGDYTIGGSSDQKLHVEWSVRDPERMRQVYVKPRINATDAVVAIEGPSNNDFRVRIRVPARSDLVVRLTAGDLRIEGIEGNKDVESHAGDVDIDVGPVADLKHVEASVWAGDLRASKLNVSKGGLFRSLRWDGKGRYEVQAHLKAGDLRLN
jgi:hypothetical protein